MWFSFAETKDAEINKLKARVKTLTGLSEAYRTSSNLYRDQCDVLIEKVKRVRDDAHQLHEQSCRYRTQLISIANVLGSKFIANNQVLEDLIALLDSKDEMKAEIDKRKADNEKLENTLKNIHSYSGHNHWCNKLRIDSDLCNCVKNQYEIVVSKCEKQKAEIEKLKAENEMLGIEINNADGHAKHYKNLNIRLAEENAQLLKYANPVPTKEEVEAAKDKCKVCNGSGGEYLWWGFNRKILVAPCLSCDGTGKENKAKPKCKTCNDTRFVTSSSSLLGQYKFRRSPCQNCQEVNNK